MFRRMFAAAALCLTAGTAEAAVITSATYNGHTYYLLTESSWQDAQAEAVTLGGNLVTINDQAEQDFVFGAFGSFGGVNRSLWIGLNDVAVEGTFVWVSGEAVAYTNWYPGEPNSATASEDYVHIIRTGNGFGIPGGQWNDLDSPNAFYPQFTPIHGVVEVNFIPAAVPEPGSAVLLAAGGLAVAAARRRRARA